MKYSVAHRLFNVGTCIRNKSFKKCNRNLRRKFPSVESNNTLSGAQILISRLFVREKVEWNTMCSCRKKLENIRAHSEASPLKSLKLLSQQTSVSKSSVHWATKLHYLKSYKFIMVQKLHEVDLWECSFGTGFVRQCEVVKLVHCWLISWMMHGLTWVATYMPKITYCSWENPRHRWSTSACY